MSTLHFSAHATREALTARRVLGGAAGPTAPGAVDWPEQRLRMRAADPRHGQRRETWWVDSEPRQGHAEGIHWRATPDLLYGVIELDEAADPALRRGEGLRERTRLAYQRIFALLADQDMPHLWRVWNYMADINQHIDGLERYRWFNLGRHDALSAVGAATEHQVPAASALGWAEGPLSIAFLAGRERPTPVENPRQVSAFHYPGSYGPRPPVFSRAVLAPSGREEWLLVSGTASIVGHETVHAGDIEAQCEETARNILEVLRQANRATRTAGHRADALAHRAYVRRPQDFDSVRQCLQRCLGGASLTVLQADVCREDLLVEVESVAVSPCVP